MKLRLLPLLAVVLLVSLPTSEALAKRRSRSASTGSSSTDDSGPLARSRGLSQAESAAAGDVLAEIASSHAAAPDPAASTPSRRYSPDYYRVYSQRHQMAGTKQKVAVKPPTAKPAPVPPPAAKPKALAVVPPPPAKPPTPPAKPVPAPKRVAIAPPVVKAPKVAPAPPVKKTRAETPPAGTPIRLAFAPQTPVVTKTPPPPPPAKTGTATPIRAAFRDAPPR